MHLPPCCLQTSLGVDFSFKALHRNKRKWTTVVRLEFSVFSTAAESIEAEGNIDSPVMYITKQLFILIKICEPNSQYE